MPKLLASLFALVLLLSACGSDDSSEDAAADDGASESADFEGPLVIGAIPDQDPEVLARNYELVAGYLADELGVEVQFEPVTEYDRSGHRIPRR